MVKIFRISDEIFKRWVVCLFLIIFTLFLLTGCQKAAQRKEALLQTETEVLKQRDRVCYQNIKNKYEKHKDVLSYMQPLLDADTTNDSKDFFDGGDKIPTDYEVKIIIGIYNDTAYCRAEMVEGLARIAPSMVPIYVQSYRAAALNIANLVERKISWKEARETKLALDDETNKRLMAEISRIEQEFEMSNYADPANQRADAQTNSTAQSLQSQQQAQVDQLRKQQVDNKPLTTNGLNTTGTIIYRTF